MAVTALQRKKFFDALASGFSPAQSGKIAGMSTATAYRLITEDKKITSGALRDEKGVTGKQYLVKSQEADLRDPVAYDDLCQEAKDALEDFDLFRRRYFGRVATPWQREAAESIRALLESEDKEFLVLNCPPGAGKTTLLHDIVCWLICRNRGIRILIGSATMKQAEKNCRRIRRSLERVQLMKADTDAIARGLAVDAESTMALDFGRFKPIDREQWTNEAFIVMQAGDAGGISEKESTVQSYGMDANFLGDRVDLALWDDLVDPKTTRSVELREQLEERWVDIAESRLDPGGLIGLVGQRIAGDDLYRFALDMLQPLDPGDEDLIAEMTEDELANLRRDKKYHHIKFRAHYEDRCFEGSHRLSAPAYPDGCLLDPRRIGWRELSGRMSNSASRFQVVYQQEDVAPDSTLVSNDEIYGYGGNPGCMDHDRDEWQVPSDFNPADCLVIATVDPSPTNYWACELWVYHPQSNFRVLVTLTRKKMDSPEFLDFIDTDNKFVGLMEEWQSKSRQIGFPIQYWVIEQNAAQRFILRYNHVKRWVALNSTQIVPHDTNVNKLSEQFGVQSIAPHYKFGRVRLPGKGAGKVCSLKLIDEVTKYPHGRTDDCVMAHWFMEWNLPNLVIPRGPAILPKRPSWAPKKNPMLRTSA